MDKNTLTRADMKQFRIDEEIAYQRFLDSGEVIGSTQFNRWLLCAQKWMEACELKRGLVVPLCYEVFLEVTKPREESRKQTAISAMLEESKHVSATG